MAKEIIKPGYNRVSEILGRFNDFGEIDPQVLQNAANRGTRVHNAITERIEIGTASGLKETDIPYFNSWKEWYEGDLCSGVPKKLINCETRLYDEKRFLTGEIDAIYVENGVNHLVDWKTSSAENKLVWPLQAAGYLQLIRLNGLCDVSNTVYFIKLCKHAKSCKICKYDISEFHFRVFDWAVKQYGCASKLYDDDTEC
jgi:hypothetical protein